MEINNKVRPESQKKNKERRPYQAPAVVYEGAITIRAGTIVDGFGPTDPFGAHPKPYTNLTIITIGAAALLAVICGSR